MRSFHATSSRPLASRGGGLLLTALLCAGLIAAPPNAHAQEVETLTAEEGAGGDNFGTTIATDADGDRVIVGAYGVDVNGNDDQGKVYVYSRDGTNDWTEEADFSDLTLSSANVPNFGYALSMSDDGERALIAAPRDDIGENNGQGSAFVFDRQSDGSWEQEVKLTADDGAAQDLLGGSRRAKAADLSADGQRFIIGAWRDDIDDRFDVGSAYVFSVERGLWRQEAKLTSTNIPTAEEEYPNMGRGVAIDDDGDRVAVGVPRDDPGGTNIAGSVIVYNLDDDGNWIEGPKLAAENGMEGDEMGRDVAISGDGQRIVAAAVNAARDDSSSFGRVYVFERSADGDWEQEESLQGSGPAFGVGANLGFGQSVSVDDAGERILVGAARRSQPNFPGEAFVFDRTPDGGWTTAASPTAPDSAADDGFGLSASLSDDGEYAAVGAPNNVVGDDDAPQGSAYAFPPSLLPVELAAFRARLDGEQAVQLSWRTASETGNRGFEIQQRRADEGGASSAAGWQKVAFVESPAAGGTSAAATRYAHRVEGLAYGQHTFRLVQVDRDGARTVQDITRTVEVGFGDQAYALSEVHPNPIRSGSGGALDLTVREGQEVRVSLYDVRGRQVRVLHEGRVPGGGTQRVEIEAAGLSSGTYFAQVQGEGFSATREVVIVR
jgi:hypothetical protein